MDKSRSGACQCGAVTYSFKGEPLFTYACHCTNCQKRTGSAFSLGTMVGVEGLNVEGRLTEWKRIYPYGQHAAHVVGYMGAITAEQVDDLEYANYLLNERVGQFGVERSMEQVLHGAWGYRVLEVRPDG